MFQHYLYLSIMYVFHHWISKSFFFFCGLKYIRKTCLNDFVEIKAQFVFHWKIIKPFSFQSLQITSFLMTVCNVVIVVLDWFVDLNLLK